MKRPFAEVLRHYLKRDHYCPDCEAHIPASDCFEALDAKGGMSLAHYGPEVEHGGYGRGTMDAPTTHWVES